MPKPIKYAAYSKIDSDTTFLQIKKVIAKYGASEFAILDQGERFGIAFRKDKLQIKFMVDLPIEDDFVRNSRGQRVSASQRKQSYQKYIRQLWRGLLATITAKFISIEAGIETLEKSFLPYIVTKDGRTVMEHLRDQQLIASPSSLYLTDGDDDE